ncbi:MAG: cytochrome c biogenesis protein CcsA [Prevotella sp.]|jgi:cytochrome c-type biogenesis protein CcsB|nr:cytochrome c biogenesis protein CcsA [Prevotella sp.]
MKETLGKIISSYKTTIVLLIIYAFGLAVATLIEKYMGTEAAKVIIYYSPIFFILQLLLVLNFIFASLKNQLFRKGKWGYLTIHFSLIIILAGALTTHIFSEEGIVHLRENEITDQMLIQTNKGNHYHKLPFSIELTKFTVERYPGSTSPSSFESSVTVHADGQKENRKISMNNVLDLKGYRLFQASYDKDEKGSILSVNKDVAGRNVTYMGYVLLVIGFILCFTQKESRFRRLSGQLKQLRSASAIFILLLFPLFSNAQGNPQDIFDVIQKNEINKDHAAKFGALPMQSMDGRMEPINTFSSEVLRKLHKSDKIGSFNSDQFLLSLLALPDMWMRVPFIIVSNDAISYNYDLSEKGCAYVELFDSNGNYKLQEALKDIYNKPYSERTRFDKDLLKLDERINIFHQIINNKMVNIFPLENDPGHKWYAFGDDLSLFSQKDSAFVSNVVPYYLQNVASGLKSGDWEKADEILGMISTYQLHKNTTLDISPKKIEAELMYNKLDIFRLCKKIYLILGGILLVLAFISLFQNPKWLKWLFCVLGALVLLGFIYHLYGIGVRWYIAGYAPWSNSYETMIYVSAITVLAGFLFARQSNITFALATLFGGIILFVSGLNWMDPQISPLVPVLKSPWLMIHVAVIVAAYGFFGISFLLGITNLSLLGINKNNKYPIIDSRIKELSIINEMSLWAGLALMTIGTFLGAVWANESWGRYWGWDPKETWALITIVVYAIVTHLRLVKKWDNPWLFNLVSALAFATVLMTYFGVNYFLSGMHSYG